MSDVKKYTYYIQGPVLWAKVFERNRDKGNEHVPLDPKFNGRYQITVGVDKETTKLIKSWNRLYDGKLYSEMKPKAQEKLPKELQNDDKRFFMFWRNHCHVMKDGTTVDSWGGPPKVVDAENFAWDDEVNIGNGSVCTIKLAVSEVGKNTYVRLEGVRVDEHVAFEGGDDVPREEVNTTDGMPF